MAEKSGSAPSPAGALVTSDWAFEFLRSRFASGISPLQRIREGETSTAFTFAVRGERFVARFNQWREPFEKDLYAHQHFCLTGISVPELLAIETVRDSLHYALTRSVEGVTLDALSRRQLVALLPRILEALDLIHSVPIAAEAGCGDWDGDGVARFGSFAQYLRSLGDSELSRCPSLLDDDSMLDRSLFDSLTQQIDELADCCKETPSLVHGDFGSNNLLTDGERITGILDWQCSKYGDPLFDVAYLDFWSNRLDYLEAYAAHMERNAPGLADYERRIRCCSIAVGLSALCFFVHAGRHAAFAEARARLAGIMARPRTYGDSS
ncbi:MAG: phosphotransferase [Planctomycetota bacterium]